MEANGIVKFIDNISKIFNRYISPILWATCFVCIYTILYVKLDIGWGIGNCKDAEKVNEILVNLSYSYLSAMIFYLLTVTIPYLSTKATMREPVNKIFDTIKTRYKACAKSPFPNNQYNMKINEEEIVNQFKQTSMQSDCALKMAGMNCSVIDYIYGMQGQIKSMISNLMEYKQYIPADQLVILEQLRDSTFEGVLIAYRKLPNYLDNERERENLAKMVLHQLELSKKLGI